jgi:hypothetical protein
MSDYDNEDNQEYEEWVCGMLNALACTLNRLGLEAEPDDLGYSLCRYWF